MAKAMKAKARRKHLNPTLRRDIIVCVVFGAIAQVLFGWSGVVYQFAPHTNSTSGSLEWPVRVPDGWMNESARYVSKTSTLNTASVEASSFFGVPLNDPETRVQVRYHENGVSVLRCGFPMKSMTMRIERETAKAVIPGIGKYPSDEVTERISPSVPIPTLLKSDSTHHDGRLPLMPMPLGFIVNTTLYAGGLFSVLFVPGAVRRAARRRRGRCPICAFDLTGLICCPECGHGRDEPAGPIAPPVAEERRDAP